MRTPSCASRSFPLKAAEALGKQGGLTLATTAILCRLLAPTSFWPELSGRHPNGPFESAEELSLV